MIFKKSNITDVDFILQGVIDINNIENIPINIELEKNCVMNAINNSWIIIAENDSDKLGFIWFNITNKYFMGHDYTPFNEDYIWISSIWTKPTHRNKNVASQLYEHVFNKAKELGIKKIWLDIYNSNLKSIDFHIKKGFKPEITLYSLDV